MSGKANCCLCSQISGRREGDLISQLLGETDYVRRVAFETAYFGVIPSLGPIVPGHTLLCPRRHVKSFAQLLLESNQSDAVSEDLHRMKAKLVALLESVYRAPVHCFEHGSAADGSRILCTVDHAHLHLLPTSAEVLSLILGKPGWEQVQPDLMEVARQMGRREYLYFESPDGMAVVTSSTSGFKSQYMRRVFASALGTPSEWNWRSNPRAEAADNLFRTISTKLTPSSARAVVRL